MRKFVLAIMAIGIAFCGQAQKNSGYKFTKVTIADLEKKKYSIDSQAHAVFIADVGSSEFIGNSKGWFSLEFKRRARIHILDKNGYDEGTIQIPLYTSGSATEKLHELKAYTYNLENGKIVESKLPKDNIFTENYSKNIVLKKFTLPNIKEGSIIDIEYTIQSDFLQQLQPWTFQGASPRIWTEYTVAMPQFFDYAFITQGYRSFDTKDKKERMTQFHVSDAANAYQTERFSFNAHVFDYKWAMKDVPALKTESFTSTVENHVAKIEFQLAAYREPLTYQNIMGTWGQLTRGLLQDEDFGKNLSTANSWLDETMTPLLAGAQTKEEKARRIYNFVRDNFTCTSTQGLYTSQSLKNVMKTKNGRVSDINLLLTAMFRYAGIDAEPVMLSTRDNGYAVALYPMISKFNYVITKANLDGRTVMLDATQPKLGFGQLLPKCYNGHGRIVNPDAGVVFLNADSVKEKKVSVVFLTSNDKGEWVGNTSKTFGTYESLNKRKKIQEKGKEEFIKELKRGISDDLTISDAVIDSLNIFDQPLQIKYNFAMSMNNQDILYIDPMFGEGYTENPFKSAERAYPVEMPYTIDETVIGTINIPEGFVVDELPKSIRLKLNEQNEGMFEHLISQSGNTISMRSKVQLKRANYSPEEYEVLREFFNMVVNKQKEQIVLKKKK